VTCIDIYYFGKDNFAADRAVAEKLLAVYPPIIETVPESRRLVERAVTWVAGQGVAPTGSRSSPGICTTVTRSWLRPDCEP